LFYGLGLEKRFKINTQFDVGVVIQKIYNITRYENNIGITTRQIYNSDLFRFNVNTALYKRLGLTTSLNFVAYDTDNYNNVLGSFRDINFSFGFVYAIKVAKNKK
jgi:hypothetical protein